MASTPSIQARLEAAALRTRLDAMGLKSVVVIGDPVLDEYIHGTTVRISREAPVPIVREDGREQRMGGGANAATNVAALGGKALLVGLVGDDAAADDLRALGKTLSVDTTGLVGCPGRRTVTKTRVLAGGLHTRKQQMLRLDRENSDAPSEEDLARLVTAAQSAIQIADAVIISDYGDGSLTDTYCQLARWAKDQKKPVIVDSRYALTHYEGVTAVTPNEPEAEAALKITLSTAEEALDAADRIRNELGLEAAVLTRGKEGMVVSTAERRHQIAPYGPEEAVDVTGAGDTVIATFTLALASGADALEAAVLANVAASVVVQKVGAATCSPEGLIDALDVGLVNITSTEQS